DCSSCCTRACRSALCSAPSSRVRATVRQASTLSAGRPGQCSTAASRTSPFSQASTTMSPLAVASPASTRCRVSSASAPLPPSSVHAGRFPARQPTARQVQPSSRPASAACTRASGADMTGSAADTAPRWVPLWIICARSNMTTSASIAPAMPGTRPHRRRLYVGTRMSCLDALIPPHPAAPPLAPRGGACRVRGMDPAVDTPADETLMQAWAGNGDVAAFEALYARHRAPLFRFLQGHLHDRGLAEELFQDVWQRVIAARAGWRPDAPFGAWLYRIAHNRLNDHWRARRHRPPAPADAQERTAALAARDDPERNASQDEAAARLYRALDELPA